jgi:hypothetical protein
MNIKQLYDLTPYTNILHDVDGVYLPLDSTWKNIGVSLSGGADSALLTYLLCNLIEKNNYDITVHIISHIRCWKTRPWQRYNSLDVYNWLISKFSTLHFERHENFLPPDFEWGNKGPNIVDEYGKLNSGDIIEIRAFAEYIGYTKNLDAYFNAVTKNPNVLIDGAMDIRNVEPSLENLNKMITTHMGRVSSHPFRFIDKSWIYKQYKRLGILSLYNITRSCEGEFANIDYESYTLGNYIPLCGKCFWCKERTWAEQQDNKD